jgi:hypothetical protein
MMVYSLARFFFFFFFSRRFCATWINMASANGEANSVAGGAAASAAGDNSTSAWANGAPKTPERPTSRVTTAVAVYVPDKFDRGRDTRFILREIEKSCPNSVTHVDLVGNKLILSIIDGDTADFLQGLEVPVAKGKFAALHRVDPPAPTAKHALRAINLPRGYSVQDVAAAVVDALGGVNVRIIPHTIPGYRNVFLSTATILADSFTKPAQRAFSLYDEDVIVLDIRLGDNLNGDDAGRKAREEHRMAKEQAIKAEADALAAAFKKQQQEQQKKQDKQNLLQKPHQQNHPSPRTAAQLSTPQAANAASGQNPQAGQNQSTPQPQPPEQPQADSKLLSNLSERNAMTDGALSEFFRYHPRMLVADEKALKKCISITENVVTEMASAAKLDPSSLNLGRPLTKIEYTMIQQYQDRLVSIHKIMTKSMPPPPTETPRTRSTAAQ